MQPGLCRSLPAPAPRSSPAHPGPAAGTEPRSVGLLGTSFEGGSSHIRRQGPEPCRVPWQAAAAPLSGAAAASRSARLRNERSRAGRARARALGASSSLIPALEPWTAAAPGQESRLCHSLRRCTASRLPVPGRMETPANYLERLTRISVLLPSIRPCKLTPNLSAAGGADMKNKMLGNQTSTCTFLKSWLDNLVRAFIPGNSGREALARRAPQVPSEEMP